MTYRAIRPQRMYDKGKVDSNSTKYWLILNGKKKMVLLLHQHCGWSMYPGRPAVCVRFPILLLLFLFYSRIA